MPTQAEVIALFGVPDDRSFCGKLCGMQRAHHDPRVLLNLIVTTYRRSMARNRQQEVAEFTFNGSQQHDTTDDQWHEIQAKFAAFQTYKTQNPIQAIGPAPQLMA